MLYNVRKIIHIFITKVTKSTKSVYNFILKENNKSNLQRT